MADFDFDVFDDSSYDNDVSFHCEESEGVVCGLNLDDFEDESVSDDGSSISSASVLEPAPR